MHGPAEVAFADQLFSRIETCCIVKKSPWIRANERNNVLVGLNCNLRGRAQIGEGMWAMPGRMAASRMPISA